MADNQATFLFILQDEGGGAAPGGEGASTPATGPTRPKTTEARAKAASDQADVIIADRVPAVAKQQQGTALAEVSGTAVRAASDTKLAAKGGGVLPAVAPTGAAVATRASGAAATGGGGLAAIAGPAAIAIAAVGAAAASGVVAVNQARAFSTGRGAEVGGLSPEIARAQAQAEVRSLNQRLRSAQRLGPTFARQIEAESRLETAATRAKEAALGPTLAQLASSTADLAEVVNAIAGFFERPDIQRANEAIVEVVVSTNAILSTLRAIADRLPDKPENLGHGFFSNLAQEAHLQPSGDAWPGAQSSGASFVAGKFNAPPGALAGGDFFLRGFSGEGGF